MMHPPGFSPEPSPGPDAPYDVDPRSGLGARLRAAEGLPPVAGPTEDAARKWLSASQPRRYSGWSIVAPVPMSAAVIEPALYVLESLRRDHGEGEWSIHPLSSLHMTVFSGMTQYQVAEGHVPDWARGCATYADVWLECLRRFVAADLPGPSEPLQVEVVGFEDLARGASATVRPATRRGQDYLLSLRDAVADACEWRGPNHDDYRFHITFGYRLTVSPSKTGGELARIGRDYAGALAAAGSVTLGPPAFTIFESMVSFPAIYELG